MLHGYINRRLQQELKELNKTATGTPEEEAPAEETVAGTSSSFTRGVLHDR